MKVVRKMDDLGRIVLPYDIRDRLGINAGDSIAIDIQNNIIILEKDLETCIFCNSTVKLISHMGKNICQDCVDKLNLIK